MRLRIGFDVTTRAHDHLMLILVMSPNLCQKMKWNLMHRILRLPGVSSENDKFQDPIDKITNEYELNLLMDMM